MALIGTIRINMVANVEKFTKAMGAAGASVGSFASRVASSMGKAAGSIGGSVLGKRNVEDIKSIGQAFRNASSSARYLKKEGLLGFTQSLRVLGGLAQEAAPGLLRLGGGLATMGGSLAAIGFSGAIRGMSMLGSATVASMRAVREGVNVLGKFGAVGAGLAAMGIYKVAQAASSLGEQTDRVRSTFGAGAADIERQARLMGDAFGVSRSEFIRSAADIGGQMQGLGYKAEEAAQIGIHYTKLAMDAASKFQIPVEEAMTRMQSAFAGQSESVIRWGVDLTEANLKLEAARRGMKLLGGEMTRGQKSQLQMALVEEGLAKVHGDLAKTAGGAENAAKGLMGRIQNLAETIGTAFLPMVAGALTELNVGIQALSIAWEAWTTGVVNDQVGVVGAMGETSNAIGLVQQSIGFVADAFQVLKIGFYAAQSYITYGLSKIVGSLAGLGIAIDFLVEKLTGMKSGLGDMLTAVGGDLNKLSEGQWGKFQEEIAKPAASENINAMFSAAQDRIRAMRAEAVKPGADVTKFAPQDKGGLPAKTMADKYASAAEAGSKEAANLELRSRYGAGVAKGPEDVTAKNTGEMVGLLRKIAGSGVGMGATMAGGVLAGNL